MPRHSHERYNKSQTYRAATIVAVLLYLAWSADGATLAGVGRAWMAPMYKDMSGYFGAAVDTAVISYSSVDLIQDAFGHMDEGFVSFVSTPAVLNVTGRLQGRAYRIPLMASALTVAYDASRGFTNVSLNTLLLDVPTLVAMWSGSLSQWDDPRLLALNPWLGLPPGNVSLVYCDDPDGEGDVLARFLARADPSLAAVLASGGSGLSALEPVRSGRARAACDLPNKLAAMAQGSLCMLMLPELAGSGLVESGLRLNGSVMSASSPLAIAGAMAAAKGVADITNGGGSQAWPMSALVSLVVATDLPGISNCNAVQYVFGLISWVQINDVAIALLGARGYAPLDAAYRRATLDALGGATCGGNRIAATAYLLGSGPLLPVYPALASQYDLQSLTMKYYASTSSLQALADMIDNAYDFATSGSPLSAAQQALVPDARMIPMLAYGTLLSYYMPELKDAPPLVMDFELIAGIFLGTVDRWDHADVARLNPGVPLPAAPIVVMYVTSPQVITRVVNTAIGLAVPEYARVVGASDLGSDYPVVRLAPNRTLALATQSQIFDTVGAVPYVFGPSNTFITYTVPNARAASIKLPGGSVVAAGSASITDAITNAPDPTAMVIYLSPGANSWPIVAYNSLVVRSRNMTDCAKAAALAEWIYWVQSAERAQAIADANQFILAGNSPVLMARILDSLVDITCGGVAVSRLAGCVAAGTICSGRGECSNRRCVCAPGWTGAFCDVAESSESDGPSTAVIVAASVAPALCLVLVVLAVAGALALFFGLRNSRQARDDWEIAFAELTLGDVLGSGGNGEVRKAVWKGTDVAVKRICQASAGKPGGSSLGHGGARAPSPDAIYSFKEEMRIMARLRHPNVVLFMAAVTKPPNFCIVMEYMALGSLYDVRQPCQEALLCPARSAAVLGRGAGRSRRPAWLLHLSRSLALSLSLLPFAVCGAFLSAPVCLVCSLAHALPLCLSLSLSLFLCMFGLVADSAHCVDVALARTAPLRVVP
jgi:ABC-type phosphate transport system substrate-binding protein